MIGAVAALTQNPRLVAGFIGAVILALVVGGVYLAGRDHGSDATVDRIERQNDRAEHTGDEAWRDVEACTNAGRVWNVETGSCE